MSARGDVDIGPFREAFARSGLTARELARRLGVDESRVRQLMSGKTHYTYKTVKSGERRRHESRCKMVSWDMAERLCAAMYLDPVEFGC